MSWRLDPFDAGSPWLRGAVEVYAETWSRDDDDAVEFFQTTARTEGFIGVVARPPSSERVIGMGFGTRSRPGLWWHDRVADVIGHGHPALRDAWVLGELAVRPGWRGLGVGGRIHDHLLEEQGCAQLLLTTQSDNVRARRFYTRRGWRCLHDRFVFAEGFPAYAVMHRLR